MPDDQNPTRTADQNERLAALTQLEAWLEWPMQILGFVWLGLLVIELLQGLTPLLAGLSTTIWIVFILDFVLRLTLAPAKGSYLKDNWITVISLIVPALRLLRVVRAFRLLRAGSAIRGVRLVKVIGSINRGMNALGRSMGRRGLGYVVMLTLLITLAGAAGMYAFEGESPGGTIVDYPTALWWTAMIMTTMGSEYWPRTPEGRALCILLALYAFAVFGYVTASLATYFVGRDAESSESELASATAMRELQTHIAELAREVRGLRAER